METLKLVMADLRKKHVNKFIMVGDLLDKGNATMETLEFITQNIHLFYLVRGNHEVAVSIIEDNARRRVKKAQDSRGPVSLSPSLFICLFPELHFDNQKVILSSERHQNSARRQTRVLHLRTNARSKQTSAGVVPGTL